MFDKIKMFSASERLKEEKLYEQVVLELSSGQKRNGLWAKALANSDGIENKAKSLYIKYRIQSIKDELDVYGSDSEETETPSKCKHTNGYYTGKITETTELDKELFEATIDGNIGRVRTLIEAGANPRTKDSMGHTPEDHARGRCFAEIEKYLKNA